MCLFKIHKKILFQFVFFLINGSIVQNSLAQLTSAGSILQGIKSEVPAPYLPLPDIKLEFPKEEPLKQPSLVFSVNQFKFNGNSKISNETLSELAKSYLNRPLSFKDLQELTDRITLEYHRRGWIVRAMLPQQDITSGIVHFQIYEALLGGIHIENKSKRIDTKRVESWIYSSIPLGTHLSSTTLDRAILTLNDQPDLQVSSSLEQGASPGETVLLLVITDKPALDGTIGVDNFGQKSTGINRFTASFNVNGPLNLGEQVAYYGLYSSGTSYDRLALTVPVGENGLRIGVNTSYLTYKVTDAGFAQLNINGLSSTNGAELTYPLLRSKPSNLYLLLNYNFSSFLNYANSATSSQYSTSVFQSGIYGNRLDNFGGGAVNSLSIYASSGRVNLSNSPSLTSDTNGPGINGGFNKLHYSLSRQQTVSSNVAILVGVSGQVASKNMDASEQMYLGGPYGVRSYATGQGNANQGITQSVEIFENLPSNFTLSQFYDYANIQTYKQSNFSGAPSDNGYSLQGVGTSLVWTGSNGLKLKAIWARRIGTLPTSIYETFIANGGLASNRFWLNASLSF